MQEILRVLTVICLHINHKVYTACNLNFIVENGLLKSVMYTAKLVVPVS